MKKNLLYLGAAFLMLAGATNSYGQTKKEKTKTKTATTVTPISSVESTTVVTPVSATTSNSSQEEMMKSWQAYMTPGAEHKMLSRTDGTWNGVVTTWMMPGQPPMVNKCVTECHMIMGGRYQEMVSKGDMMGMPFEGRGIIGFDNEEKMFVSSWIDNFGTGMMHMKGKWDEKTNSITMTGMMMDPMSKKEQKMREVHTMTDNDHMTVEMFSPGPDGKEFRSMEIVYTRG